MKQNERLLVYAVTGFLAIVLLVAVLFGPSGRDAAAKNTGGDATNGAPKTTKGDKSDSPRGLNEILGDAGNTGSNPKTPADSGAGAKTPANDPSGNTGKVTDTLQPNPVTAQQPLVASERPLLTMDLVTQQLGASRRDRMVRMVRARSGDSLEKLVRRWCGTSEPFLDEAKALNEDLVTLRVGQEICVPWVDDEIVLAAYEASKPKTLTPAPTLTPGAVPTTDPNAPPAAPARPTFAEPGANRTNPTVERTDRTDGAAKPAASAAATTEYVVKSGDSLWKIADRTYGRQNAPKMIGEIKRLNPEIGDTLRAGQKIVLPAK